MHRSCSGSAAQSAVRPRPRGRNGEQRLRTQRTVDLGNFQGLPGKSRCSREVILTPEFARLEVAEAWYKTASRKADKTLMATCATGRCALVARLKKWQPSSLMIQNDPPASSASAAAAAETTNDHELAEGDWQGKFMAADLTAALKLADESWQHAFERLSARRAAFIPECKRLLRSLSTVALTVLCHCFRSTRKSCSRRRSKLAPTSACPLRFASG